MKRYRVEASKSLKGKIRVPGDKSIGHRALMFGALAEGPSQVEGLSGGLDNIATANAFKSMGVPMELDGTSAQIHGVGLDGLRMPNDSVDCGNSGTTMRLLSGLLVGQKFGVRLFGDESLSKRPMGRVISPLRARGGHIGGTSGKKEGEFYPPLSIAPLLDDESLAGIEYDMPVASAQLKSALLLSGLYAKGPTAIREPVLSRDHTERMMLALGVPLETFGPMVVLNPEGWSRSWNGFDWTVPGDFSSAAFFMVAGSVVPGSQIEIENVGTNPTRTGLYDALRTLGAQIEVIPKGEGTGNEPVGQVDVSGTNLRASSIGGELLVRMIDEVPIYCVAAALAHGTTEIRDAAELRVKESDRIAVMANVLRGFGVACEELEDGMVIHGTKKLNASKVESHGDHRIAMSAAILGLCAEGETIVENVECVDTSFPGFATLLRSLGANIVEETV